MSRSKRKVVYKNKKQEIPKPNHASTSQNFHFEFMNQAQRLAWGAFDQHDVLFLLGPAGCGKTQLSCAFAISEILALKRKKIILTRPVVEAGESLGFLPGGIEEKLNPYMMPMYDCMETCLGKDGPQREIINKSMEIAPIAFCRGRTFKDSVCIFDEAQNATKTQIKLFMTRFGHNSKMIITGDPDQSDINGGNSSLLEIANKMEELKGVAVIRFKACSIVRHPLIAGILDKFEEMNVRK
ncbi:MAG: PhoH family protein [Chryseobacterium sp.]|jgi:phosphate starvation-inducible PhoH-like protein